MRSALLVCALLPGLLASAQIQNWNPEPYHTDSALIFRDDLDYYLNSYSQEEIRSMRKQVNIWRMNFDKTIKATIADLRTYSEGGNFKPGFHDFELRTALDSSVRYDLGEHKGRIRAFMFGSITNPPARFQLPLWDRLLDKYTGKDVFRIDLSRVVSKYIGETEKNLSRLFDKAENKDWILFFDEADALFGKRTDVKDSHDRYANQEVSFLLQRVEDFSGIVILASNFKSNIDDAFIRRFQTVVHFPIPKPAQRLQLWQNAFSARAQLAANVNLQEIAQHYELTGGAIVNVVRYCSLMAVSQGTTTIQLVDIEEGIRKEFLKEGKTM